MTFLLAPSTVPQPLWLLPHSSAMLPHSSTAFINDLELQNFSLRFRSASMTWIVHGQWIFGSPCSFSRNRFQMLQHQLCTWACHVASNDRRQAIFMTSLPHWISLSSCSSPSFDSWHGSFSHDLQMLSCTPDGHVEVDSHHLWHPVSWSSWLMSSSFGNSPGWHCMCLRRSLVFWSNLSESTSAVPLRIASPKGEKLFWLIRSFRGAWVNGVPSACVKCCWLHTRSLDSISFASVTLHHSVLGLVLLAAGSTGGFKCPRLPACFGFVIHQIMACTWSCCLACLMFFKHFKCTLLSAIFAPSPKETFFTAHMLSGRVLCNFAWQVIVGCTHSLCCHFETHCWGHPIHHMCNQVVQKGQAQFWDCSDVVVRTCESGWHFWSLVTTELFHAWTLLHQGKECQQWMLHWQPPVHHGHCCPNLSCWWLQDLQVCHMSCGHCSNQPFICWIADLFWCFAGHSTWLISQHIWGCHSQKCASVKIMHVTSAITFQQDWALERKEAARSKSLNKEWSSKSAINCTTAVLTGSWCGLSTMAECHQIHQVSFTTSSMSMSSQILKVVICIGTDKDFTILGMPLLDLGDEIIQKLHAWVRVCFSLLFQDLTLLAAVCCWEQAALVRANMVSQDKDEFHAIASSKDLACPAPEAGGIAAGFHDSAWPLAESTSSCAAWLVQCEWNISARCTFEFCMTQQWLSEDWLCFVFNVFCPSDVHFLKTNDTGIKVTQHFCCCLPLLAVWLDVEAIDVFHKHLQCLIIWLGWEQITPVVVVFNNFEIKLNLHLVLLLHCVIVVVSVVVIQVVIVSSVKLCHWFVHATVHHALFGLHLVCAWFHSLARVLDWLSSFLVCCLVLGFTCSCLFFHWLFRCCQGIIVMHCWWRFGMWLIVIDLIMIARGRHCLLIFAVVVTVK